MRHRIAPACLALSVWLGCFSPALAQARKVAIGINSMTAIYWPAYVARAKGMFSAAGLDADIILTGSPVSAVQQLVSKSIDIAHPTLYVAVNALAHDADLTLVGCIVNTLPYSMLAKPQVASVKDLIGKRVVLGFRSDTQTLQWREWVKGQGVNPDDIDQIYDPQAANRYAALAAGHASVALLNAPFDVRARAEGAKTLLDFGPISKGYAMAVVAVRPEYLNNNADIVRAYLKATQQAIDWLYDPGNRDEAIAILAKDTRQEPAIAAATYADYVLRLKPFDRNLDLPDFFLQKTLESTFVNGDVARGYTLPASARNLAFRPQ